MGLGIQFDIFFGKQEKRKIFSQRVLTLSFEVLK